MDKKVTDITRILIQDSVYLTLLRKSLFWAFMQISSYSPLLKKCAVVIPSIYPDYCRPPPLLQRLTLRPRFWKDWGSEKKNESLVGPEGFLSQIFVKKDFLNLSL